MKVEITIINRLGTFVLDHQEWKEDDFKEVLEWFKGSKMSNFVGVQTLEVMERIIFPHEVLKESIFKWRQIKE